MDDKKLDASGANPEAANEGVPKAHSSLSEMPNNTTTGCANPDQELMPPGVGPSNSANYNNLPQLLLNSGHLLRQHEDEHLWRKLYLQKSFYLVATILYLTFIIVLLVGIGVVDLTDAVLMTMLGTTVAHVVGILAIAFHWLYPHTSNKPTQA